MSCLRRAWSELTRISVRWCLFSALRVVALGVGHTMRVKSVEFDEFDARILYTSKCELVWNEIVY